MVPLVLNVQVGCWLGKFNKLFTFSPRWTSAVTHRGKIGFLSRGLTDEPLQAPFAASGSELAHPLARVGKKSCQGSTSNPRLVPTRDNFEGQLLDHQPRRIFLSPPSCSLRQNSHWISKPSNVDLSPSPLSRNTSAHLLRGTEAISFPQRNSQHCGPSSSKYQAFRIRKLSSCP